MIVRGQAGQATKLNSMGWVGFDGAAPITSLRTIGVLAPCDLEVTRLAPHVGVAQHGLDFVVKKAGNIG